MSTHAPKPNQETVVGRINFGPADRPGMKPSERFAQHLDRSNQMTRTLVDQAYDEVKRLVAELTTSESLREAAIYHLIKIAQSSSASPAATHARSCLRTLRLDPQHHPVVALTFLAEFEERNPDPQEAA